MTAPTRITIVPDDYHVPYAGTAGDGRRFFLSEELFTSGTQESDGNAYVGLFLWSADGSFDEVKVDAVGRPEGVVPDLITFAKGVNSGYVPAGGVIISESIAHAFDDVVFPGGLTYSGHPLAMASIVAALDAMEEEGIVENAATIGRDTLGPGLAALADAHPLIGEVRGLGVFWALDLVTDPETREPVSGVTVGALKKELLARGLLPFVVDNRIHVVPPCTVSAEEVVRALAIYDEAFTAVEATL